MPSLDFDGDYGRHYRQSIQHSVPGYDVLNEIAAAAIRATSANARHVLVVGPGPGDELLPLLDRCPEAEVTVIEPSAQMLDQCRCTIADHLGMERCRFLQSTLADALSTDLNQMQFDLVVCHNVLHLMPPLDHVELLQQLIRLTGRGGALLLSSYSESEDGDAYGVVLEVARQRLMDRGLTAEQLQQLLASRNRVVFSVDASRVAEAMSQQGWPSPVQLYQGLFARLWLCSAPQ
jgi:ubiquinone/menaquinone biosynthesis C-methylase UbiE